MPPVTIAIGFKADGTPVHLYSGFNALEAVDKLDSAGAGKQIVEGAIYHNPSPIRTRKFTEDGVGSDTNTFFDEQGRMKRINELKKLGHAELVEMARDLGVKLDGKEPEEKVIKRSMAQHMYLVVAIYDAEAKKTASSRKPISPRPDILNPGDVDTENRRREAAALGDEAGRRESASQAAAGGATDPAATNMNPAAEKTAPEAPESEKKPKGLGK